MTKNMKIPLAVILAVTMMAVCALGVPSPVYASAAPTGGQTATIAAGMFYSMAVKADGSLWTWGIGWHGVLGDGAMENRLTPAKIMDGVRSVAAGENHSMAIKTDGSLWTWGFDAYGEGLPAERGSPLKIMEDVKSIAAGFTHSLAVKTDGSLWTWGINEYGKLGDGTEERRRTPTKIMDGVSSVAAGENHSMAVKTDGSLWAWGNNEYGQLGDGTAEDRLSPVMIMDGVVSIAAGGGHSLAIRTDGRLWAWGNNEVWQLGAATIGEHRSPVKVMDGVSAVAAGWAMSMAVKTDGSLWDWGNSFDGDVRDGGFYHVPMKLMDGMTLPPATASESPVSGDTPDVPSNSAATIEALPAIAVIAVNGAYVGLDAYEIEGNNYFKLRDVAYILSMWESEKQFDVGWSEDDDAILLTRGAPYAEVGGEMTGLSGGIKTPVPSDSKILLDGAEIELTAYNIDGNNYFKFRDIGKALDFDVDWDADANSIVIDVEKIF